MTRNEWLRQIEANPGDWQMALIAADEIESDGDELFAEQLRFAVQWVCCLLNDDDGELLEEPVTSILEMSKKPWFGTAIKELRADERRWCEQNNVRFVPFFPRSLNDVYAGRELV